MPIQLLFNYTTCYSTILSMQLNCSKFAKNAKYFSIRKHLMNLVFFFLKFGVTNAKYLTFGKPNRNAQFEILYL